MGSEHAPLILIELVLVFGSVLAFAWWQLRSLERDRKETLRQRELEGAKDGEAEASERQTAMTTALPTALPSTSPGADTEAQIAAPAPHTTATDREGER